MNEEKRVMCFSSTRYAFCSLMHLNLKINNKLSVIMTFCFLQCIYHRIKCEDIIFSVV